MKRIAVFPGSFDPITVGHESIIKRGLQLFDEIVIGIGHNSNKQTMFTVEQRLDFIQKIFQNEPRVSVTVYEGLTINFCMRMNAKFILRGLRNAPDFEYERTIAHLNKSMESTVETVFLITEPEFSPISSTIVREILKNKGDVSKFIPKGLDLQ